MARVILQVGQAWQLKRGCQGFMQPSGENFRKTPTKPRSSGDFLCFPWLFSSYRLLCSPRFCIRRSAGSTLRNMDAESQAWKALRWHVCRVNFARKIFFELRIFLRKNAPKFSPNILSLYSMGQKKIRKIPAKFPCEESKKITDELLQGRRENKLWAASIWTRYRPRPLFRNLS